GLLEPPSLAIISRPKLPPSVRFDKQSAQETHASGLLLLLHVSPVQNDLHREDGLEPQADLACKQLRQPAQTQDHAVPTPQAAADGTFESTIEMPDTERRCFCSPESD